MATEATFHVADYVLFACTLLVSAGIGVYFAIVDRNKVNTKDFLLAGGNMNPIPVAMSLLASFMSAITVLGTPTEMYQYGTMYWWIGLCYPIVIFFSAHVYIPIFYNLKITSVFEYLEMRFGKPIRTATAVTFAVQMLLYMAIVLYAPSLALNAATGFTLWGAIAAVTIVCTLYTTVGGMKAVLWTDTFQVFMMFAGLFAVVIRGSMKIGGFTNAWRIMEESGRIYFTDFSFDPSIRNTFWSLVVGAAFIWTGTYGTNQAQVQRTLTTSTLKQTQFALWINCVGLIGIMSIGCFTGIIIYAYYSECDPLSLGRITNNDQLMPKFVMDVMGGLPGLPGVFVACLFSAALSTVSSGLNSLAAVILHDVIMAHCSIKLDEKKATNISKGIVFILGFACLGLAALASVLGDVLEAALSLFGIIGGPILGLFSLGMFFPWANLKGAFSGLITSLVFLFWIGIGAKVVQPEIKRAKLPIHVNWTHCEHGNTNSSLLDNLTLSTPTIKEPYPTGDYYIYQVSYLYYSLIAVLTVLIVGMIVSLLTGPNKPEKVDARLICPLFDILFPYLPEKIRKPMRFGVVHKDKYTNPSIARKISLGYDNEKENEKENEEFEIKKLAIIKDNKGTKGDKVNDKLV